MSNIVLLEEYQHNSLCLKCKQPIQRLHTRKVRIGTEFSLGSYSRLYHFQCERKIKQKKQREKVELDRYNRAMQIRGQRKIFD